MPGYIGWSWQKLDSLETNLLADLWGIIQMKSFEMEKYILLGTSPF